LANRSITATTDSTAYIASKRKRNGVLSPFADVFYRRPNSPSIPWTYSISSSFSNTDFGLHSIEYTDYNTGFAGGAEGILYKSEDPTGLWGINFNLSESNPNIISSISFPTSSTGMFAIGKTLNETNYTLVYHTNDNGDSWTSQPDSIANLLLGVVHAPDTSNAWAVGSFGKIFKGVPSTLSINQLKLGSDIAIFPNPTSRMVNIKINSKRNAVMNYCLLDMSGRVIERGVWSLNPSNPTFTLDLYDVDTGAYLLQLTTNEGKSNYKVFKN
jgi:hypothetical protein